MCACECVHDLGGKLGIEFWGAYMAENIRHSRYENIVGAGREM